MRKIQSRLYPRYPQCVISKQKNGLEGSLNPEMNDNPNQKTNLSTLFVSQQDVPETVQQNSYR